MQNLAFRIRMALAVLTSIQYVFLHELGHYLVAVFFGLGPKFIFSSQSALSGFAIGVAYAKTSAVVEGLVILGAVALPLLLAVLAVFFASRKNFPEMLVMAEVLLLLVLASLIPLPGMGELDANKLASILFSRA